MTPAKTLDKLEVARRLLDRAVATYLDANDAVSAIVLGGAAEELLQGALIRRNRRSESSRSELARALPAVIENMFPDEPRMTDKDGWQLMLSVYNWLKHDDGTENEPLERKQDWDQEAQHIIMRAMDNWFSLFGEEHGRAKEFSYPVGR